MKRKSNEEKRVIFKVAGSGSGNKNESKTGKGKERIIIKNERYIMSGERIVHGGGLVLIQKTMPVIIKYPLNMKRSNRK